MILKPSMIISGDRCSIQAGVEQVATYNYSIYFLTASSDMCLTKYGLLKDEAKSSINGYLASYSGNLKIF